MLLSTSAFKKEAERASQLNDPHIAAVHDLIEHDGRLYLVMEYVEGETLRARMRQPLTPAEFFSIAEQCLEGIAAAHQHCIVHCDLKPENLMITPEGKIKILDFGFAQPTSKYGSTDTVSCSTSGGTPGYIAPEVLLGGIPDERSDIFSLGVVLYESLARHHPFRAESADLSADSVERSAPALLPPAAPKAMNAVLARMLAKERRMRHKLRRLRRDQSPKGALAFSAFEVKFSQFKHRLAKFQRRLNGGGRVRHHRRHRKNRMPGMPPLPKL